jgi:glucokinase
MRKQKSICIAIDIGGTKIDLGVIDSEGHLQGQIVKALVPFDVHKVAQPNKMIEIIRQFVEKASLEFGTPAGIGLSVCGNIDSETGEAVLVPNLHWRNIPFGKMVQEAIGLPVYAATDVRDAALAEHIWGAAQGVNYFAWCTIGTGYGGYLYLDNQLYGGFHGFAGNFGHITYDEIHGYPCGCGKRGCFETYVAGPAIARAGQAAVDAGHSPLMAELSQDGRVTTQVVFQAYAQGDPAAVEIVQRVVRLVAINLSGVVNLLDLEMIVMGGGIVRACPDIVELVSTRIRDYLMTAEAKHDLRIVRESFENAALYGAAADVYFRSGIITG